MGITLAPVPPKPSAGTSTVRVISIVLGAAFLLLFGIVTYNYIRRRTGGSEITLFSDNSSGDKLPAPADGKTRLVIPGAEVPVGVGTDYGLQFWMFIQDWDYKFGQEKQVLKRIGTGNSRVASPYITLHPTDNSLQVRVSIFPSDSSAGAATPASTGTTGDSFTCTVENVPLQSWFSVSATVFQRNLDIYINGRLVKSCVLPGIPKPVVGDIILGDNGGFSGSICNLNWYNTMLAPEDCKAFHSRGTQCAPPSEAGATKVDEDSIFITLFGYTFRFSTLDKKGKELTSLTF